MKKYIFIVVINFISCNRASEDIINKDCNCTRQQKRIITDKHKLGETITEEMGESWSICKEDSNGWVYYGNNVGQGYPVNSVNPQISYYYKITCDK